MRNIVLERSSIRGPRFGNQQAVTVEVIETITVAMVKFAAVNVTVPVRVYADAVMQAMFGLGLAALAGPVASSAKEVVNPAISKQQNAVAGI